MGTETLLAHVNTVDPVLGGVCQYSTDGYWQHPHFEKIMQIQAENIRTYTEAYALWRDPIYLHTAEKISGYLTHFLQPPEGASYASQDADLVPGEHSDSYFQLRDSERTTLAISRIDQPIHALENRCEINALAGRSALSGR